MIKLYAALDSKHQLIYAINANQHEHYFCPQCQKIVQWIDSREHRRPYFRHQSPELVVRQEGRLHVEGKRQLQVYLQLEPGVVESEISVGDSERRADVLWLTERQTFAFEFQCASLSTAELRERHQSYQRLQTQDVWLLGETYLSTNRYQPKKNALKFMDYRSEWGYYLAFWLPDLGEIRLFRQLAFEPPHVGLRFKVAQLSLREFVRVVQQPRQLLADLPHLPLTFNPSAFLAQQLNFQQSSWLTLQTQCYEHGFSLQQLPSELWLPQRLPPLYLSWTTPLRRQVSWFCQNGTLDWATRSQLLLTTHWPLLN